MSAAHYQAGVRRRVVGVALALFLPALGSEAQQPGPVTDGSGVSWQVRIDPAGAAAGQDVQLVFSADIADGWILYSSDFKSDLGPRPARFKFDPIEGTELVGPVQAVKPLRRKDRAFHMEYTYFERHAEFRQQLKIKTRPATISGHIDGQACHETDGTCTLVRKDFSLRLE